MHEIGKALIVLGLVLAAVGVVLLIGPKLPFLGKLPGDIFIKRDNFTFFFPLTTGIVLSVLFSLILYFISRFR